MLEREFVQVGAGDNDSIQLRPLPEVQRVNQPTPGQSEDVDDLVRLHASAQETSDAASSIALQTRRPEAARHGVAEGPNVMQGAHDRHMPSEVGEKHGTQGRKTSMNMNQLWPYFCEDATQRGPQQPSSNGPITAGQAIDAVCLGVLPERIVRQLKIRNEMTESLKLPVEQ